MVDPYRTNIARAPEIYEVRDYYENQKKRPALANSKSEKYQRGLNTLSNHAGYDMTNPNHNTRDAIRSHQATIHLKRATGSSEALFGGAGRD